MRSLLVVRHRGFRLLWVGETTSELGSSVASLAVPLLALGVLHASALEVSLLTAAAWAPWLVIGLPAGVWVDRLRRRSIMIVADLVAFGSFVSVPVAWWCGVLTVAQLLGAALAGGVASVLFRAAYRAYLPSLVDPDDLSSANAALQGSESATQVGGPGLAGLLTATVGASVGVLVDAVSFLVSAFCLWRIGDNEAPPVRSTSPVLQDIRAGWRFTLGDDYLRAFVLFGGLSNMLLTAFGAIQETFLVRTVGLSAGVVGLLVAGGSAGGVVGAALAPGLARRFGSARVTIGTKAVVGAGALMIPLAHKGLGLAAFVVGSFVLIGAVVAGNVVAAGFLQSYVPGELLGRVTTAMQVVNLGPIPFGAVLGGLLAEGIGLRPAMWVLCAALLPAASVLFASPVRRLRDLPTAPTEAARDLVAAP